MKKPKPVHIKWRDSYALNDGWGKADYSTNKMDINCETIGWLCYENKLYYFVALNISHKKEYGYDSSNTIMIPKGCVVKKVFL